MKKAVRIMALILAFACLFSGTVFAEQSKDTTEEPTILYVQLTDDIQVKNDNYASLFPEIDIALVESLLKFDHGEVYMEIRLADTADDAGEKAVEALAENQYVKRASTKEFFGAYVGAFSYYPKDGDINLDGKLTNSDVISLARYIVGMEDIAFRQISRADIDKNGAVNNVDLVAVAQMMIE